MTELLKQTTGVQADSAAEGTPAAQSKSASAVSEPSQERSPWDKFTARLRGVRLTTRASKLRSLRDEANAWDSVLQKNRDNVQAQLDAADDPLDKAAYKEELETINENIDRLKIGLTAINTRAKVLVEAA